MNRFVPGDPIVVSFHNLGKPRYVHPATVVSDTEAEVAVFWGDGFPFLGPPSYLLPRRSKEQREVGRRERETGEWELRPTAWRSTNVLLLARPDVWWSRWVFWDAASWDVRGYYVNVEEPWRRTPAGFVTRDLALDITISADRTWSWKDEDEYAERVAEGFIDAETAARVEAERPRMIAAIEAREPPFDGAWDDWRPDPSWQVPSLPD